MWVRRVILFWALSLANLLVLWSPDVLPNSLFWWSVAREGDVDYDEFTDLPRDAYFFRACGDSTATEPPRSPRSPGGPPAPGPNDRVCSIFPPGAAILAAPFFLPPALSGAAPQDLPLLLALGKLAGAFSEALAAVLLIEALGLVASPRWAFALGVLYLLATAVRTISAQALWQHGPAHLLTVIGLYVVLRAATRGDVGTRRLVFGGLALGFAVVVRQTSVVFALAAVLSLLFARRAWPPLLLGVIAGIAPLLAYHLVAFGDPLEQGYGPKLFTFPVLEGLYGLLFSPSRGLFVYAPFLVFALPPLLGAWLGRERVHGVIRWWGAAVVILVVGYATYAEWWGGRVFGARFLSDVLPVLFLSLATAPPAAAWSRAAFVITSAWALVLHNAGALAYLQTPGGGGRWDTEPVNVNLDPSRLLEWSDPQWLAVLRDLVQPAPADATRIIAAAALSILVLAVILVTEREALRIGSA